MEPVLPVPIPASHVDLVDGPYWAALTTLMPDGQPQTTPVWCDREPDSGSGSMVRINSMATYRKTRNMRADPRVALLVIDPRDPLRSLEIRGRVVHMTTDGADEHNDALTRLYLGRADARFYGDSVPAELRGTLTAVKITIRPERVRVEGGPR